jgi:hypothetical protein
MVDKPDRQRGLFISNEEENGAWLLMLQKLIIARRAR